MLEPTLKEISVRALCDVRSVRKWRTHDPGLRKLVRARIEAAAQELRAEMRAAEASESKTQPPVKPDPEPVAQPGYFARVDPASGRTIETTQEV